MHPVGVTDAEIFRLSSCSSKNSITSLAPDAIPQVAMATLTCTPTAFPARAEVISLRLALSSSTDEIRDISIKIKSSDSKLMQNYSNYCEINNNVNKITVFYMDSK
jgi:hypothetical protein